MKHTTNNYSLDDTIVALSSPYAKSAIAVIRMSGKKALDIAKAISISTKSQKSIESFASHKAYYVELKDGNRIVDDAVLLVMKSPNTYTTENIVEIYSHGSIPIIEKIIALIIKHGARLASAGEFTYRAYINGRLDISEATAIHDLIDANNYLEAEASIYKMKGRLKTEVEDIRNALTDVLIQIEGNLDFPEDDDIEFSYSDIDEAFRKLLTKIEYIIEASNTVRKFINGVRIAIVGKTNVGKSSIFNMLLDSDRAIVSDIAGTTRDSLHECIYIDDIPYYLTDTAGFHGETNDKIEQLGIERSTKCINEADIILAVFDYNSPMTADDNAILDLLKTIKNKTLIFVLNKTDLVQNIDYDFAANFTNFNNENLVLLSVKNKSGKAELIEQIKATMNQSDIEIFKKETYINMTEKEHLLRSIDMINCCLLKIDEKESLDIIAEEARLIVSLINNISHPLGTDDIINEIFSRFCIGK